MYYWSWNPLKGRSIKRTDELEAFNDADYASDQHIHFKNINISRLHFITYNFNNCNNCNNI